MHTEELTLLQTYVSKSCFMSRLCELSDTCIGMNTKSTKFVTSFKKLFNNITNLSRQWFPRFFRNISFQQIQFDFVLSKAYHNSWSETKHLELNEVNIFRESMSPWGNIIKCRRFLHCHNDIYLRAWAVVKGTALC